MMKIALLIPSNKWFSPYVNIYTRILDDLHVEYTQLYWNRDGSEEDGEAYGKISPFGANPVRKIIDYLGYVSYVKRKVKQGEYDKLIVFSPQLALFMAGFLKKRFGGRYLFDFRDLSIEQHRILHRRFESVLQHSYANVVSSYGFLEKLPKGDYLMSHNFNAQEARVALESTPVPPSLKNEIKILTIGGIRDFDANSKIMMDVANQKGVSLSFIGKGLAAEPLRQFAEAKGYDNIHFTGFYDKKEENKIVCGYDLINAYQPFYPHAMTNRLYLALILKRPLLVVRHTIQAEFVEKYGLGVSVDQTENVADRIKEYFDTFDFCSFAQRCNEVLKLFLNDYAEFRKTVQRFVEIE